MMKKLLILMMVLGMTSLANAGALPITLEIVPDTATVLAGVPTVVGIDVKVYYLDPAVPTGAQPDPVFEHGVAMVNVMTASFSGTLTGYTYDASATAGATFDGANALTMPTISLASNPPGPYAAVGAIVYEFNVNTDGTTVLGETLTIGISGLTSILYSHSTGDYSLPANLTVNGGTITVVPEPMTIALLGLGSLFLMRRRRK